MKVVVTGSSSHLSRVLLPALCNIEEISEVIGIDIALSEYGHPKFRFIQCDIREKKAAAIVRSADTIIHTAFVVLRSKLGNHRKNRALIKDININGSINIFRAALEGNANCLIHISSASVYGAIAGNPAFISEEHPRTVMRGFTYAEDKNALEDWLDEHQPQTDARIIRFRPHVILGPRAQPFLLQLIKQPFYPFFPNPQPKIQCVWEDDVAAAIIKAIFSQARGIYNLASQPPYSFKELIQATHNFAIPLPFGVVKLLQNLAWRFTAKMEEPGWIDGMQHSLVVDTRKAETELNWKPSRTSLQCAIEALKK